MKIAMFTNNYLPRVSGPAHSISVLQNQLKKLNHNVIIYAPKYFQQINDSDNIIRIPSLNVPHHIFYPIPLPNFSIEKHFCQYRFDIIHSHHPIFLGQLAMHFSKKYDIPLVYSYHSQWHSYLLRFFNFFPFHLVTKIVGQLCDEYALVADAVIIPHRIFKTVFSKIDKKKVFVIPFPISDKFFDKKIKNAQAKLRKKLKLPFKSKIILAVSRISFEKNIDFLIESFALLKKKNIFLVIIGDGVAILKIKSLIRTLDLKHRVILLGQIHSDKLPLFYQGCDIFAQVSDFETQCLALNEAMASGCIIVAKKADYLKGVIINQKNGYLVDGGVKKYAEALNIALSNNKNNNLFSLRIRADAKKYSAAFVTSKIEKVYKKIIR